MLYAPVTHWGWGGGWLGEMELLDFAGVVVVHVTACRSAPEHRIGLNAGVAS